MPSAVAKTRRRMLFLNVQRETWLSWFCLLVRYPTAAAAKTRAHIRKVTKVARVIMRVILRSCKTLLSTIYELSVPSADDKVAVGAFEAEGGGLGANL